MRLLIAVLAAAFQLSPPTLEPVIRVYPSPQITEIAKPAGASATAELPQWHGQNGGSSEASTETVRTQQNWSRLWSRLDRPMPRSLDESREMAIFIGLGSRPTGGFVPRILSAAARDGKFVVTYAEGKPSADTFVTQAFSHPWVVAIIDKTSLPLVVQAQAPSKE